MSNTSKPSSSSKGDEASKPVKKRQKSSKTSAKETGSKSTDRCEPLATNSEKEINTEEERWYELLEEKIGLDINAKEWMKKHPELAYQNKSELLIRLAYELCLAKNTEYDPENENEEQNNKYAKFDTKRIFALFEVANSLIEQSDRKSFVEFICQKGNVQLLEMICQKEAKDAKGGNSMGEQYKWSGTFTGYSKLIDLLQYVIDNQCVSKIVLCIAEKMYARAHLLCNGGQYLDSIQVGKMKENFDYQDSAIKEFLKKAIELGYKDTVSVMLSGDIYHSIRLMKWEAFQKHQEFLAAYDMIKETVADIISSWVEDKQFCKSYVQNLLDQGIEIDLEKMDKEDLVYQLEYLGEKVTNKSNTSKEKLIKELEKEKGKIRLRSIVVGALISTLFFKHRDEAMKGESFTLKTTTWEKSKKQKKLNELNQKISSEEPIKGTVLELIKSLNSSSYLSNNWFFREVLAKIVNENLEELKAVCTAICKEPMEELKWMIKCVEYELARETVSDEKQVHIARYLLEELSLNDFADAQFSYAVALLSNKFKEDEKEKKVYDLLRRAVDLKHPEARLLLGMLPFIKGYGFVKEDHNKNNYFNYLKAYVDVTFDDKDSHQKLLKEKVSIFVAYEHINYSPYVPYNKQEAINILQKNCNKDELKKLEKAIGEGRELSGSLLNNILQTLRYVSSILQKEDSGNLHAQKLSDVLEQLRKELKGSKITIQQPQYLPILQQLNSISSPLGKQGFLLLQQLWCVLGEEVKMQPNSHLTSKILLLIESLNDLSEGVQTKRSRSYSPSSSINDKPKNTRRYSATETLWNEGKSVVDTFMFPSFSSKEAKIERIVARSNHSTALALDDMFSSTALSGGGKELPFLVQNLDRLHGSDVSLAERCNTAVNDVKKGEYNKACSVFQDVFNTRKDYLGYKKFSTIIAGHNLAFVLYALGQIQNAEKVLSEMLHELGKNSNYSAGIMNNIRVISEEERWGSTFKQFEGILHNGDGTLEVDGAKKQRMSLEPQSYLSNASIQSHLTQDKAKIV